MGFLGISGSTWKKIGKVALKVAPIVAAPFTGGASLLALGVGTGVASGLLDGGGVKGALLGGALGAIPGAGGVGSAAGGAAKASIGSIATGLAKGAATNFGVGTATGLATGQGLAKSLESGGSSALSGAGTMGGGGIGSTLKSVGLNTAKGLGGSLVSGAGSPTSAPSPTPARPGGNVYSSYLGDSDPASGSTAVGNYNLSDILPMSAVSGSRPAAKAPASGIGGTGGTGTPAPASGGGTTPPATSDAPQTWAQRYGPILAQAAGVGIGALVGKKATSMAQARSPEEQAALTGAQGAAGTAGKAGGALVGQGQDNLQAPGQYFKTLLSGNRGAMNQAVAAPVAQITGNYRGAERALDAGGVRGASRDVALADLNRQRVSQIAGLTTGMQPYAAEQLAKMGTDSVSQGAGLLGTSGNVYANLLKQGSDNRQYARTEGGDTAAAIGGLARDVGEVAFKGSSTPATKTKPKAAPSLGNQGIPGYSVPTGSSTIPFAAPPPTPSLGNQGIPGYTVPSGGSSTLPFGAPGDYDPYGNG